MHKLVTSFENFDDLSIGFDRDRVRRQLEVTKNRSQEGKYHVRIQLSDVFGFVEHQEEATYVLSYNLTLTRNNDNSVLNKGDATNNGKSKINGIE